MLEDKFSLMERRRVEAEARKEPPPPAATPPLRRAIVSLSPGTEGRTFDVVPPGMQEVEVAPDLADLAPPEGGPPQLMRGGAPPTPGGMQPFKQKWSQEGAVELSPEVRRAYETGYGYQARGLAGEEAAKRGGAVADALGAQAKYEADKMAADQLARMHQARDNAIGQTRQMVEDLSLDIRNDKVDGRRYWKDLGVADKVRMGISALFSGIAGGLAGKPLVNRTLDLIEKRNDQDAMEQLREIQEKKGYRAELLNSMDGMVKLFGGEEQAILANKALKYTALEAEVEKYKLGAKSALARAQFDSLLGGLALKRAETLQKLGELGAGKISTSFEDKYAKPTGGGGGAAPGSAGWKEPTSEEMAKAGTEYQSKLTDQETALRLMGEATGLDGGTFARYAEQNPGMLANTLAKWAVNDRAKFQKMHAALYRFSRSDTGAAMPPEERATIKQGLEAGDPLAIATSASIIAQTFNTRRNAWASGHGNAALRFEERKRRLERTTRPKSIPTSPPVGKVK